MIRSLTTKLATRIFENPKGVAYHQSTLGVVLLLATAIGLSGTTIAYIAAALGAALVLHAATDTHVTDNTDPQRVPLAKRDAAVVGLCAALLMLTVAALAGNVAPWLRGG